MTKPIEKQDTFEPEAGDEITGVDEPTSQAVALDSESDAINSQKLPPGWIDFDDLIRSLPTEQQMKIADVAKRMTYSIINSRRASGCLRYLVISEKGAYLARCLDVDVVSEGDTREEAVANLREALKLFFEIAPETYISFKASPEWCVEWRANTADYEYGQLQFEFLRYQSRLSCR